MTVSGIQVVKDKATELNFTLAPLVKAPIGGIIVPSTPAITTPISTPSPDTTATLKTSNDTTQSREGSGGSETTGATTQPEHQPIQPQDFRHHGYSDMELFLRKYSNEFPSIARLYTIGKSVEGRELFVMEISNNPGIHMQGMDFIFTDK